MVSMTGRKAIVGIAMMIGLRAEGGVHAQARQAKELGSGCGGNLVCATPSLHSLLCAQPRGTSGLGTRIAVTLSLRLRSTSGKARNHNEGGCH